MGTHNNISKVLNAPASNIPWNHSIIRNAFDNKTTSSLLDVFHTIDWSNNTLKDHYTAGIFTHSVSHDFVEKLPQSLAKDVLQELNGWSTHELLLQHYNIDYSTGYEATLVFDYCNEQGSNELHNDTGPYKDVLTLQYYLQVDDETRTLHLSGMDTCATSGDAVMFKSQPLSMHSFNAGNGNRFSLRLRIMTNVLNPTVIQNKSDSKIGVLVDCKDMESDSQHKLLEVSLGAVTYRNLIQNGFSNIVVFREREDYKSARDLLKEHGVEKVLMVFAGATVDETTFSKVEEAKHISASINSNNNIALRQFVVFDINDSEFDIVGDYLGNVRHKITDTDMMELSIAVLHPDEESVQFLSNICQYEVQVINKHLEKLSNFDKQLATIIRERVSNIQYKRRN